MRLFFITIWATCLAVALWGTTPSAGQSRAPASYTYILMVNIIGPAANTLWQTAGGSMLSDQDWDRAKEMAQRLMESAALLRSGGTSVEDIERAKSREWETWAGKFADTVSLAATAANRKDRVAFAAAAGDLIEVCQGCHQAFPQAKQ